MKRQLGRFPDHIRGNGAGSEVKRRILEIAADSPASSALTKLGVAAAHSAVGRKNAAMGQDGHACMASAETSRNSFSVAPLAD